MTRRAPRPPVKNKNVTLPARGKDSKEEGQAAGDVRLKERARCVGKYDFDTALPLAAVVTGGT